MIFDLSNPYFQLMIFGVILLLTAIFTKLDVSTILITGAVLGSVFILSSLFYGVYFDKTWSYILHAFFSALWIALSFLADKFGQTISHGEGFMILMMPGTVFPAMFVFAIVSKLIFDFFRSFF
ncbi:MAG: hypothetical protein QM504_06910 [Pseudomonadota bacterium]